MFTTLSVARLSAVALDEPKTDRVRYGQAIHRSGSAGRRFRIDGVDGTFLGLGEMSADGWLNPRRPTSNL